MLYAKREKFLVFGQIQFDFNILGKFQVRICVFIIVIIIKKKKDEK